MTSYTEPRERSPWFRYRDGWARTKKRDEAVGLLVDWTRRLDSGEISAATWAASGPTLSSTSNTTTQTSARVSGLGEVKITVTTTHNPARTLIEKRYFLGDDEDQREDYRG